MSDYTNRSMLITSAVARIERGLQQKLHLGNLDARRDWGYAPEYVEVMWRMLQQDEPGDYVIATGESHSVREFARTAFEYAGLDWREYVETDLRYYRPAEPNDLVGDATKARVLPGWEPTTYFHELVRIMVDADMRLLNERIGLRVPASVDKQGLPTGL